MTNGDVTATTECWGEAAETVIVCSVVESGFKIVNLQKLQDYLTECFLV